jgi:hypothetical protein
MNGNGKLEGCTVMLAWSVRLAGRFAIGGERLKLHTGFVMKVALYAAFVAFTLLVGEKAYGAEAICGSPAVIFCEDFANGNFAKWQDGYDPNRHTITTDPTNVYQGSKGLQVLYPKAPTAVG